MHLHKQIIRFLFVGGAAFVIDYAFLYIFTNNLHIHYLISAFLSFTLATVFNYIASVKWVFDVDEKRPKSQNFILFVGFSIVGLGINEAIMYLGVDILREHFMVVKIFATAIVMVFNFVSRKMFLEAKRTSG